MVAQDKTGGMADEFLDHDIAERALVRAEQFLDRIEHALREGGYLV